MMQLLLMLTSQTLAGTAPISTTPSKKSPSIYALVFVEKRPGLQEISCRNRHMKYEAAHCTHGDASVGILRTDSISRLTVVRKQKDAPRWLREHIRVDSLEDTGVLRIWLAAGTPEEQVVIVNAVAKAYVDEANERTRKWYEVDIDTKSKDCAEFRKKVAYYEAELLKLSGVQGKDKCQGERLFERRKDLGQELGDYKQRIEKLELLIREDREYLRKPRCVLLELAELPPEPKE